MNLEPLRRLQSKLSVAFVAAAALVLSSCGGGGATSSPTAVGNLQLLPGSGSLYAGVPYTFTIAGGRKPYLVTSNEPTLIQLGYTVDGNEFTIVARNPGVVDVGLDPNEVPRRTVNIEVRDSVGNSLSNAYNVLQNFFTGYGESYLSTCAASADACSGSDTIIGVTPVSNGTLYGNRTFQFDKVRGDFQFVVEDPSVTPQLVNRLVTRTDHLGKTIARIRVTNDAPTQRATYTITDVATGASTTAVFTIVQAAPIDTITVLPATLAFQGGSTLRCGTGTTDVMITGGTPPYTVTSTPGISVNPSTVTTSGGFFTLTVGLASPPCPQGTSVNITDSRGARATVTVDIQAGTVAPPSVSVAPATLTLLCDQTGQATAVGGNGGLFATSSHPRVTAFVSGQTVTVTRLGGDLGVNYPLTATVTVSDGSSVASIGVSGWPATCP